MFISYKSNFLLEVTETEWDCRRRSKGMTKSEYWAWIETISSGNPPKVTYPSETFTILEITDENVSERLGELSEYVDSKNNVYNIKVYKNKKNNSHFEGDDTAKDARLLADKWANIRNYRNKDLASSDWTILDDSPLASSKKLEWQVYRQKLRDIPKDNDDPDDINWPTKP